MMIPMIGYILCNVVMSVLTNYVCSPAYMLVASLLATLTGGWQIMFMSMYSYIGDYTTDKVREWPTDSPGAVGAADIQYTQDR